jgi:ribosomal protein L16 Arg81 hydroxylase
MVKMFALPNFYANIFAQFIHKLIKVMKSRLLDVVKFYEMTLYAFAQKIEVSHQTLSNNTKKNKEISSTVLSGIALHCPEINLVWLLTGEGSMLANGKKLTELPLSTYALEPSEDYQVLKNENEKQENEIHRLRKMLIETQNDLIKCLKNK